MIGTFESMVRMYPERVCFIFVDESGQEERFTYRTTRLIASGLARRLQDRGVQRGDCVSVDLPNCPAFVFLLLASAYASFTLVPLNHRLTAAEKQARLMELERQRGVRLSCRIDRKQVESLIARVKADLAGQREPEDDNRGGKPWALAPFMVQPAATGSAGRRRRVIMGAQQDAEEEAIHFAERQARLFDEEARALIMFTSGTTGKPKAVPLAWQHLMGSAAASNTVLNENAEGLWQAALPLYHIGGLQVLVRSFTNRNPFVLYARFDAKRLLEDAERRHATHVSVVDKMLQDLLDADEREVLQGYRCILLGGGALNRKTLARALSAKARVYASYGMTETSSQIAHAQVTRDFEGGLRLLPGYRARIVDPNEEGYGRLGVRGPGVFAGYLNARAAFTVDGYFLTGDTAALVNGRLYLKERTSDMFVSGGENVYPAEIAGKLMRVPGVADAHVFGAADPTWGRRPVAFVERDAGAQAASMPPSQFAAAVRASLEPQVSKLYLPRQVFVVDELPRVGIGKVDRGAVERQYEERIEVKSVSLYQVRLPFKTPFKTPKATLGYRDSLVVEVTDHAGRTGLSECVAFATDWYLPETLEHDAAVLQHLLAPKVLSETYLHPREAAASLDAMVEAAAFPLARGALEPALWDLYGKIVGKPLWKLVNEEASRGGAGGLSPRTLASVRSGVTVGAGAVVGLGTPRETVEAVKRCVEGRVSARQAEGGTWRLCGARARGASGLPAAHGHAGRQSKLRRARHGRAAGLGRVRGRMDRGAAGREQRSASRAWRRRVRPPGHPAALSRHAAVLGRVLHLSGRGLPRPRASRAALLRREDRQVRRRERRAGLRAGGPCMRRADMDGRHVREWHIEAPACGVPDVAGHRRAGRRGRNVALLRHRHNRSAVFGRAWIRHP